MMEYEILFFKRISPNTSIMVLGLLILGNYFY
jgi:hypothetical protein